MTPHYISKCRVVWLWWCAWSLDEGWHLWATIRNPIKFSRPPGEAGPPSNIWFIGPTRVCFHPQPASSHTRSLVARVHGWSQSSTPYTRSWVARVHGWSPSSTPRTRSHRSVQPLLRRSPNTPTTLRATCVETSRIYAPRSASRS